MTVTYWRCIELLLFQSPSVAHFGVALFSLISVQAIFHCIIDLLPGLAGQSSLLFNRYFYLLESLTIVQTPLVLCTLPSQSLMLAFIDSLLSLCQHPINSRVAYYIAEILSALLNELNTDEVTPQLIDGLLKWLTAEKQVENPTAAETVLKLLDRHKDKLERMVCKWSLDILTHTPLENPPAPRLVCVELILVLCVMLYALFRIRDVIVKPAKKGGGAGDKKHHKKGGKGRTDDEGDAEEPEEDDPDRIESVIMSHADQLTIFKLIHIEVPSILPSIHSELADLLQCDAWEGVRREFTGVYSDIFIARPTVIRLMAVLYEALLARFKDVSNGVRAVIAERAGALMIAVYGGGQLSPVADEDAVMREGKEDGVTSGVVIDDLPHREQMSLDAFQDSLTISVQDKEETVRQHAVKSLAAACIHSPALVNLQLLTLMGKRCLDRSHEVRKESLIGLSHVFHHHLTPYWRKAQPPPAPNRKLRFIPSTLLTSVKLDTSASLTVELAMDNHLIGLKQNEVDGVDQRTTCLLAIFDTLESETRTEVDLHVPVPLPSQRDDDAAKQLFLNRFITQKAGTQHAVHDLIAIQQQIVTLQQRSEDTSSVRRTQQLRLLALSHRLFFDDDANYFTSAGASQQVQREEALRYLQDVLYGIFTHDDPDVIESLLALCDSRTPLQQIREAVTKLRAAIKQKGIKLPAEKKEREAKPPAAGIANRLGCFCSQAVLPIDSVPFLFQRVSSGHKFTAAALELLIAMADAWPLILSGSVDELYVLLQQKDDETIQTAALHMMSLIDFSSANIKHSMLNKLKEALKQAATTSSNPEAVKYAIRAIKAVFTENTAAAGRAAIAHKQKINLSMDEAEREDAADKLLHQLFQHYMDHLSETEERLDAMVAGIGEVSVYYPRLFKANRDRLIPFFLKRLFVLHSADHHSAIIRSLECMAGFLSSLAQSQLEAPRDDHESEVNRENTSIAVPLVAFFIKIIINKGVLTLSGQDSVPSTPANKRTQQHTAESKEQTEDRGEAEDDGDEEMVKTAEEKQVRHNQILLTAGKCLIDLCLYQPYRALLFAPSSRGNEQSSERQKKPFHFAPLAFLAQSTTDDVRLSFLDHVVSRLHASQLPFSFAVILCLSATIEENAEFKARIKQQLDSLVMRTRKRAQVAEAVKQDRNKESGGKQPVNPNLPELVLADLIYLLSYHPEFVDSTDSMLPAEMTPDVLEGVGAVYNYFLHILQHFLDSVTERSEGNYSLLLAICSTIKNSEDVRDPSNTKIYKLADLVQLAVHKRSENKVWKASINTVVSLPRSMYQPRKTLPKERYLPKGYTLPAGRGEKDGAVHAPSTPRTHGTPRKRKGGDESPASFGLTSPSTAKAGKAAARSPAGSGSKSKKVKVDKPPKEVATPSRQMPSRNAKAAVATYNDDELAGDSEDDEDDVIPARKSSRNGVNGSTGNSSTRNSSTRPTLSVHTGQQVEEEAEEEGEEETEEDDVAMGDEDGTAADDQQHEDGGEEKEEEQEEEEDEYSSPVRGKQTKAAAQRAVQNQAAAASARSRGRIKK